MSSSKSLFLLCTIVFNKIFRMFVYLFGTVNYNVNAYTSITSMDVVIPLHTSQFIYELEIGY